MAKITIFCLLLSIAACTASYDIFERHNGESFYLVPSSEELNRVRRQADVSDGNEGLTLSYTGNIIDDTKHRLDGKGFAHKDFQNRGPLKIGGNVDYTHIPTASKLNLEAAHTRGLGTDVGVKGHYNFYNSESGSAAIGGHYNRHFGGPFHRKPNYGVFVRGEMQF